MTRFLTALYLCLALLPARAEAPLSADAFEAYTTGKTLFYGQNGRHYGAERYLPGRRVLWSFLDGECKDGSWFEDGQNICFVYDDNPQPQCWQFTLGAGGLIAAFQNDPGTGLELYEAQEAGEMLCLGPRIGA